jgi:hypothetical protein
MSETILAGARADAGHTRGRRRAPSAVGLALVMALSATAPASAATLSDPVVEGLIGPLGLAVGDDGTLYVGEAFGGQLTSVDRQGRRTVLYQSDGSFVAGVDAAGKGHVVFTETVFPEVDNEDEPPETRLARVLPNGNVTTIASLSDYETAADPDAGQEYGFLDMGAECLAELPPFLQPYSGIVESNPYAVKIHRGGYLVADAAANAILHVGSNGRVSTVAVLAPVLHEVTQEVADELGLPDCAVGETYYGEPVPTDVEVGPDGGYYVSLLPGGPGLPGSGEVRRIDPATGEGTTVASGLTSAVDLAVAGDGTIYVAELFGFTISRIVGGVVQPHAGAPFPSALEVARDGTLYAAIGAFGPSGSVVQVLP